MTEFRNEFFWSKTRDEVFKTCPRQYWFAYYGYWNGWLDDAPQRDRQIYLLKNLKNRHAWAGEKVHECIERSLNNLRRGIRVLPVDEIVGITVNQMRSEFRSSRAKNYLKNPKTCALFEHEYGLEVTDEAWRETAGHVETCLRNFYGSDIYDGLKSHRKDLWLEVEEFSSFHFDDVKVNLVVDCAIREGDDVIIYDWKTGKTLSEDLSVQLCCYALYAMERWHIPSERLRVIEFNLSFSKANEFSVTRKEVEALQGYMKGSIDDMRSLLIDVANNIPFEEERFSRIEDDRVSQKCNFRKICRAKEG